MLRLGAVFGKTGAFLFLFIRSFKPYPSEWYQRGVEVVCNRAVRESRKASHPQVKSNHYVRSVQALCDHQPAVFFDLLLLDED